MRATRKREAAKEGRVKGGGRGTKCSQFTVSVTVVDETR